MASGTLALFWLKTTFSCFLDKCSRQMIQFISKPFSHTILNVVSLMLSQRWYNCFWPRTCLAPSCGSIILCLNWHDLQPICPCHKWVNTKSSFWQVLSSRNVQLLLGYFVRCIRRKGDIETSHELSNVEADHDDPERFVLELEPAERGLKSQTVEADLVLWTIGSKPLLPQLETVDQLLDLSLNSRGQAETDETLRVKGHPRIFALGDSSALRDRSGKLLPDTAQVTFTIFTFETVLTERMPWIFYFPLRTCFLIFLTYWH